MSSEPGHDPESRAPAPVPPPVAPDAGAAVGGADHDVADDGAGTGDRPEPTSGGPGLRGSGPVDPRWYDDPRDPGRIWVWDGRQWTPHARGFPTPWYRFAATVLVSALAVFVWLYAMLK